MTEPTLHTGREGTMAFRKWTAAALSGCLLLALDGCAGQGLSAFGLGSDKIHVQGRYKPALVAQINSRRPVYLLLKPYTDTRPDAPSQRIGTVANDMFVSNLSGHAVVIDENVSTLVTRAMRDEFNAAGYHVVGPGDPDAGKAQFTLTGTIKGFRLDVKARDEVDMRVQTEVQDPRTDASIWSGTVTENSNRFAGMMGDSRGSLTDYVIESLQNVTRKTASTVTASLSQAYPNLFLQAGTPMAGVSVQTAPEVPAAPAQPQPQTQPRTGPPVQSGPGQAQGTLSITTTPTAVQVYLGDVYYGLSPLNAQLPAGIYEVRLQKQGYQDVDQKVAVRPGDATQWTVPLQAK